jgi:hypothetical protein
MLIHLLVEANDPPTGTVALDDSNAEPVPFVGWLGLLRVLSELLGHPAR